MVALAMGMASAYAAEASLTFSSLYTENTVNADKPLAIGDDGVTVTFAKGAGTTDPQYYTSGTAQRLYAGNTMTFAGPDGATITAIAFELRKATYNMADDDTAYTTSTGTFTADPKTARTASWTGSTTDGVTITIKNAKNASGKYPQFHINKVTVTYTLGVQTKCSTPKFSLSDGTYYGSKTIALTCSTEGAKIMYKVNDGAEAEYTEPVSLSVAGTYAISAYATKDGLEKSETATANYTISDPIKCGSIEEFIMQGESDSKAVYEWTFPVTVTYQIKGESFGSTYVKDAQGGVMYIFGKDVPTYNVGDVIPAGVQGSYQNYNGLYEMTYPNGDTFAAATDKEAFSPAIVNAGSLTTADINKIVCIRGTYDATNKKMSDDSGEIAVYYQKNWNVDSAADGQYDLLCAVAVYKTAVQVYPISFNTYGGVSAITANSTAINTVDGGISVTGEGNVAVYNAAGQLVAGQAVNGQATIDLAKGFYIVRAAGTTVKVIVK